MDLKKNKGLKLWEQARQKIPGGNGLLSKRPERYVPGQWPTYFSKAKECTIWDLDGNSYIDMAQMGIGSCILGYCNDEIDDYVKSVIDRGINTTLNSTEEIEFAHKLIDVDDFADSVKFARTGGEAMSIAVRIARASSKKEKIAFSGYHGWSDWYLATNLGSKNNLDDHLLPGLSPLGVPEGLKSTVVPFKYNDSEDLYNVFEKHKSLQNFHACLPAQQDLL